MRKMRSIALVVGIVACAPTRGTAAPPPQPPREASPQARAAKPSEATPSWTDVKAMPAKREPELARRQEPAPGRSDGPQGISGFCPPRGDVFALPDHRELVVREPCSGSTHVTLRDGAREQAIPGIAFNGAGGQWRAYALAPEEVLLVHESGQQTSLVRVDLDELYATFEHLPPDLDGHGAGYDVAVAHGAVFVGGGTLRVPVGSGGCNGPRPAGMGCDPVVVYDSRPNRRVYSARL
jgi:hypothetical protein